MAAKIAVVGGKNDDAFWNIIKKGRMMRVWSFKQMVVR
jgi:hypothetical protein